MLITWESTQGIAKSLKISTVDGSIGFSFWENIQCLIIMFSLKWLKYTIGSWHKGMPEHLVPVVLLPLNIHSYRLSHGELIHLQTPDEFQRVALSIPT